MISKVYSRIAEVVTSGFAIFVVTMLSMMISGGASVLAQTTADALRLDLTQDGLDAVAREIQSRFLQDIDGQKIDDIHRKLKNGWILESRDLEYSVDFRKLDLKATTQGIRVDFLVNRIELHAGAVEVSRPFLWWDIGSRCSSVDISIKGGSDLALSVLLNPVVTDAGTLDADLVDIIFAIDEDSYEVRGPVDCSGILGFGKYMRQAVSGMLVAAREQVAEVVKREVVSLVPESVTQIDAMLHQSYELHVGYPGVPFAQDLILTGAPSAVESREGRVVFTMSSEISAVLRGGFVEHFEPDRRVVRVPPGIPFGSVGLNKKVINDALDALHPLARKEFEIDTANMPQLRGYLNAVTLSSIWPDLQEISLDAHEVRAFISSPGLPTVEPIAGSNGERTARFAVNIPDAKLSIMVKSNGKWMRYANVNVSLVLPLSIDMQDGEIAVELHDMAVVDVHGGWADGYTPVIDIFESDLAKVLVKSLLEVVYLRGPFLRLLVPVYDFGGGRLGFANPQSDDPFFTIDLVSAKR